MTYLPFFNYLTIMKNTFGFLSVATLASAIVVPDLEVFAQLPLQSEVNTKHTLLKSLEDLTEVIKKPFEHESDQHAATLMDPLGSLGVKHCTHKDREETVESLETGSFDYQDWIEDGLNAYGAEEHLGVNHKPIKSDAFPHLPDLHIPKWTGTPPKHAKGPPSDAAPPGKNRHPKGSPPKDGHHPKGPKGHRHPKGPKGPKGHHHPKGPKGPKGHPHPKWPHPPPKHGKGGKHHHHHHPPHHLNLTIYEAISKSKYTTIFAKYVDEDGDLVSLLNSTKANYTLFVPTDEALKKLPKDFDPPKEVVKKVLQYHLAPGLLPSYKLAWLHTVPTTFIPKQLGGFPQRVKASFVPFFGLKINHIKVSAANIVSLIVGFNAKWLLTSF
jgi:hypothetical protein